MKQANDIRDQLKRWVNCEPAALQIYFTAEIAAQFADLNDNLRMLVAIVSPARAAAEPEPDEEAR